MESCQKLKMINENIELVNICLNTTRKFFNLSVFIGNFLCRLTSSCPMPR